jgi:hypothetical protein
MKSLTMKASRGAFERQQESDEVNSGRRSVALGAGRRCGAVTASCRVVRDELLS